MTVCNGMRSKVTAGRGQDLYGHYHRLINALARSAKRGVDWKVELRAQIERFDAESEALDLKSARSLREDLCAQFEHEALHSTRPFSREILLAAVKWLEIGH